MSNPLRQIFDANKPHGDQQGNVKVLVALKSAPDDACLASLKSVGLSVETVAANKVTGEIDTQSLAELEHHEAVVDVERSVKLKPTDSEPPF